LLGGLIITEVLELLNHLVDVGYRGGTHRGQALRSCWGRSRPRGKERGASHFGLDRR
jgi:hypothetical protein